MVMCSPAILLNMIQNVSVFSCTLLIFFWALSSFAHIPFLHLPTSFITRHGNFIMSENLLSVLHRRMVSLLRDLWSCVVSGTIKFVKEA